LEALRIPTGRGRLSGLDRVRRRRHLADVAAGDGAGAVYDLVRD